MIRTCPHCQAKNRIPPGFLASEGKCGRCRQALPPQAEPIDVDGPMFDEILRKATVPVLVDFWAPWCGPCKMVAPEFAKAAKALAGKALLLKVNTETQQQLAARFGIRSIPSFKMFVHGEKVLDQSGALSSGQIIQLVQHN